MVSNCGFFEGKPFTYHVDNCRAGGSALALSLRRGNQVSVINSTIAGHGDCLCLVECDSGDCDGSETLIVQNNIFMGYPDFGDPSDKACYLWFEPAVFGTVNTDYNVVFDAKIGNVGLSANDLEQNPLVVDSNLETFDAHLQAGSPAIDSGLPVGSIGGLVPNHDLENNPRPADAGVDRGAYETIAQDSSPTPPTVSSTTPANNATDVGVNTALTATFSEEMDASSITTDTFLGSGSGNIAGTVTYSDTRATFTPTTALNYNTTYTATITTGAEDLAGNSLQADHTWSFTTESETDGVPGNGGDGAGAGDGGGGGCFIATAAYGSSMAEEVVALRKFRENVLLRNSLGRTFVKSYHEISPPLAHSIRDHQISRTATILALTPVIYGAKHTKTFVLIFLLSVMAIPLSLRMWVSKRF